MSFTKILSELEKVAAMLTVINHLAPRTVRKGYEHLASAYQEVEKLHRHLEEEYDREVEEQELWEEEKTLIAREARLELWEEMTFYLEENRRNEEVEAIAAAAAAATTTTDSDEESSSNCIQETSHLVPTTEDWNTELDEPNFRLANSVQRCSWPERKWALSCRACGARPGQCGCAAMVEEQIRVRHFLPEPRPSSPSSWSQC